MKLDEALKEVTERSHLWYCSDAIKGVASRLVQGVQTLRDELHLSETRNRRLRREIEARDSIPPVDALAQPVV